MEKAIFHIVSSLARSFWIEFVSYLQITKTGIKSRMSSNSCQNPQMSFLSFSIDFFPRTYTEENVVSSQVHF